ncbi:MAG: sugar transferase [Desulfitobacteriaceae bacterium]|nr:sugar transferase [Desulfitobacteriaceae bacterium]MDD3945103.1 sugar transferase [Bacteroidales bacterium]
MRRFCDFVFSVGGLLVIWPIGLVLYVIGLFDTGSPFFIQERVGRYKKPFRLVKFRTMRKDTKSVASHLADPAAITSFGHFLRKTKLDELPQLINVARGDMSLVGPRPNLFNQEELLTERDKLGVYNYLPGITGLAQINAIDMSTPLKLAQTDAQMMSNLTIGLYFRYIFATVLGKGRGDRVG